MSKPSSSPTSPDVRDLAASIERRILVIDDSPTIHDDFRKIFASVRDGAPPLALTEAELLNLPSEAPNPFLFQIDYALQGKEGMLLAQAARQDNRPYAVAFVDVRMPPGWDGIETALRIWEQDPDVQVVLCTAYSDYSLDEIAQRLGHTDRFVILKKPFDNIEVLQWACSLTEKWRLFGQARAKIEDLRRQLEERYRQAQKMEALGQLAGGIAHDFNNMLLVINGYCDALLNSDSTSPEQSEALKEIYIAGERAAKLTSQLLAFSRQQPVAIQAVDLSEVATDMAKFLRNLIGENIDLRVEARDGVPAVLADRGMVEQVLLNLVINARDAMPRGGRLTISTGYRTIDEAFVARHPEARAGKFGCLSVEDSGHGIASDVLPRIFEPFFTTKEAGEGTGLGLAAVFGLVGQQGGWVQAESEPGAGSVFRAFLPVSSEIAGVSISSDRQRAPEGRETILLVEDEASVRMLALAVLQKCGYRVLEAANAEEALDVWKRHAQRTDLLFTDLVMTGEMTGRELAEKLRAKKPSLKVIYTSGYSERMGSQVFDMKGEISFIQKPYHPRKLEEAVRRALDGAPRSEAA